jgi:putative transposase
LIVDRTITIPINCNKTDYNYLKSCQKEAARIWNDCIELQEMLFENDEYINVRNLKWMNRGYSEILGSHVVQSIYYKFLAMRKAAIYSRKSGRTDIRFPHKYKQIWNPIWDYASFRKNKTKNELLISRPNKNHKNQPSVRIKTKIQIPENMYKCELIQKNGKLFLAINYHKEILDIKPQGNVKCGVDLGEIHSIAAVSSNGDKLIITGRKLRSYYRFFNKEFDKLNARLKRCTKGSKNYWKYRNTIQKLIFKLNKKVNYHLNVTSCRFTDWCFIHKVDEVFIGDLSKFNLNLNAGKQNRRLCNWTQGMLRKIILDKCGQINVKVNFVPEYFTSQVCNCCGNKYKPKDRNYICECGNREHRDINAAINILSKGINDEILPINLEEKELKYLQIA